jgi:hypothetical protein
MRKKRTHRNPKGAGRPLKKDWKWFDRLKRDAAKVSKEYFAREGHSPWSDEHICSLILRADRASGANRYAGLKYTSLRVQLSKARNGWANPPMSKKRTEELTEYYAAKINALWRKYEQDQQEIEQIQQEIERLSKAGS